MGKYIHIIILVFIPLLVFTGCNEGDFVAGRQLWHAHRLREEKLGDPELATPQDFNKVIAAFRQVIQDHPDWRRGGEIQLTIARLYLAKRDLAQAKEEFKKVMENHPQDLISSIEAQVGIGALYEHQGEWERAKVEFQRVANFPHVSPDGRLLLRTFEMPLHIARHYQMRLQREEAEKAFAEAIAGFQEVAEANKGNELGAIARSFIARAYLDQGKGEEAIKTFQALIAIHPQSLQAPMALFRIGQIYQEQLRLPARAIEAFRKFIENYPQEANAKEAQLRLGQLYALQGDLSQAIKEFQLVLDNYPKDDNLSPSAQLAIASLYELKDKWDLALVEYKKVISDFPGTLPALRVPLHIARYYQAREMTKEAEKAFQEAVVHYEKLASEHRGTPFGLAAAEFLASTHFAQEDWEAGVQALQKLIDDYPQAPQAALALFQMAEIYQEQLNLPDRAIETYRQYIEVHPGEVRVQEAQIRLGQLYARKGDFSQAIKEFQLALDKHPRDEKMSALAQLSIASLYGQKGEWDQALIAYRKVLSDFPGTPSALPVPLRLAQHYQLGGRTEEAKLAFQEAVVHYEKLTSEHRGTIFGLAASELLASTHFAQEDWEAGVQALQKLIDDYPQAPQAALALFQMAEIYQTNLNQAERAIQIYEEIRRRYLLRPEITAPALFRIGQVHQNILNQPGQAKAIYRRLLANYPEHGLAERVREELKSLNAE